MIRRISLVAVLLSACWVTADFALDGHHSLREFDGHEVGHLETEMWQAYYGHHPVDLFRELIQTLRAEYHLPFWRSVAGAYHAARAAVVFQRGHNRPEYEKALPDLISYYGAIRRGSDVPFDVDKVSRLELEWWIAHRERDQHQPADLERALAALQSEIYGIPASAFELHSKTRAEAMLIRDERSAGGVTGADWTRIAALLDTSWTSAQRAVSPK
jgi:hypothetical protein